MGAAYLARPMNPDQGVPSPLVLKLLHSQLADSKEFVQRFAHEAEIAVAINSPHVASVFDVGQVGETLYIALEYVPGWTLGRVISAMRKQGCAAPIPVVHAMVRDTARGLSALHDATDAHGQALMAVHRDVSPKNLMVGDEGRTRVIDLGLMKSKVQAWQTTAGKIMGSPGYMAAEQIRGQPVDRRADVFALGVIAHELLCNRRYIPMAEPVDMLKAALRTPFVGPSGQRKGLSKGVDKALEKAMTSDLLQRWPSALEFERALGECLPSPAEPEKVQGFLRNLLPEDFVSRRKEVSRLVALPMPEDLEAEATVVFVRRPGVHPEPEGQAVNSTRIVGASLRHPTVPMQSLRAGPQSTQSVAGAQMQSLSWSQSLTGSAAGAWPFALAVAIALGIGFGFGAWATQSGAISASPGRAIRPQKPSAAPRATVSPGVLASPSAVSSDPTPVVKSRPRPRPATLRPAKSPAPVVLRPQDRAKELQARALQLKARRSDANTELVPQVDLLLARLAMLKAAGYAGDADAQLTQVAAALKRLDHR